MSHLAHLLERDASTLVARWRDALTARRPPDAAPPELLDHVTPLVGELVAALRAGRSPAALDAANAHGVQRQELGFDLDALVAEYNALGSVILDAAEQERLALSASDVRVLHDVLAMGVAEGVRRHLVRARQEAEHVDARQGAELRLIVDALPVLVSFVTADERYGLVNKAYEEWFGVPREQILGRKVREFIGEGAYAKLQPFVKRGLAGEQFSFEQYGIPYRLGGVRDVRVDFVPRRDATGVQGYVALLTDITKQRAMEREREQSAAQRTEVLESMGDAFLAVGRDWRILLVNHQLERLVNKRREELVGARLEDAFPYTVGQPSKNVEAYRRCMTDRVEQRVVELHPLLGLWLEVRVYPSEAGIAVFVRDVSTERKAEQAFQRQAQFEQHLIGIVSHDLRNPLNVVHMASSMLARRETLSEGDLKNVVRIRNANERAVRLVHDLLDFTQARLGGGIRLDARPCDLRTAVNAAVEELELMFPSRLLQVQLEGDLHGHWDVDRLSQVVQNLVTNALKYSPDTAPVRVTGHADAARGDVVLTVHNEGTPIPAAKLATIFEPYHRAVADTDNASRSVGLGLYIVNELVAAHGGTIDVRSTETEGTTFTIRLPKDRNAVEAP